MEPSEPQCPQCGQLWQQGRSVAKATVLRRKRRPWLTIHPSRPPERWHRRLAIFITVLLLWNLSVPGYATWSVCFGTVLVGLSAIVLAADYLLRCIVALDRWNQQRHLTSSSTKPPRRPWLVTPLCVLLIISALWLSWPAWVRFQVGRDAFESVAQSCQASDQTQWLGTYRVHRVRCLNSGTVFFETGSYGTGDVAGLAYQPDDQAIHLLPGIESAHPLTPHWYTVVLRQQP